MKQRNTQELKTISDVVSNDYCVGCGACAYLNNETMRLNDFGCYEPELVFSECAGVDKSVEAVCPMLNPEWDENYLSELFLDDMPFSDEISGKYQNIFAAHVVEKDFRAKGSSGGMGSWLATELMRLRHVDGVIHVSPREREEWDDPFYEYRISRSEDEIRRSAHSHYHVVEISKVIAEVKETPGNYLFVGVPCMVKAIRRLQLVDEVLRERIVYTLGLVCGHLKSVHWSLSLGWAAGIEPDDLSAITFREKLPGKPAKAYFFRVEDLEGNQKVVDSASCAGGKYNQGAMMPNACNYCDDVTAETADITIGDAWLPKYKYESEGKNIVIVRSQILNALVVDAVNSGRLSADKLSSKDVFNAQAGGFRQRREGLAYRLNNDWRYGRMPPVKRSFANLKSPNLLRSAVYRLRQKISVNSKYLFREALRYNRFDIYSSQINRSLKLLRTLELLLSGKKVFTDRVFGLWQRFRLR